MAANIDQAITDVDTDIAAISASAARSLFGEAGVWISGMFGDTGIFGDTSIEERTVSSWEAPTFLAQSLIEGPGNLDSTPFSSTAMIDRVFRALNAVKFANINGFITQVQEDAVVALYNLAWT